MRRKSTRLDWYKNRSLIIDADGVEVDLSGHLRGTSHPEWIISAPVGTTYTDTMATGGAIQWIKATGTGVTGWRVTEGDTGWRTIPGAMFTEGELLIRRVNQAVYVTAGTGSYRTFKLASASPAREIILPSGFLPDSREFVSIRLDAGKAEAGVFELAFDGGVQARMSPGFSDPGVNLQAQTSTYLTSNSWPIS